MKRIMALLGAAAALSVVAVLAVGAQAAPSPAEVVRVPVDMTFDVCDTGTTIDVTGEAVVVVRETVGAQGVQIYLLRQSFHGIGTDEKSGVTYRVNLVGGGIEVGDTDGPDWTRTETAIFQFIPIGKGTPLFGHVVMHVTYKDGEVVVEFERVSGDEACIPWAGG